MADLIKLDWDGKHYELELQSITGREFKSIKTHLGMKSGPFIQSFMSLDNQDADAVVALLWLCKKRAGEQVDFEQLSDLPVFSIMEGISTPDLDVEDVVDPKGEASTPTVG
jgi:hypothetical protein